ncbi:hypothetical protein PCASD_13171 [Puccinia coronata f. sp. avenae]|uniref:Integrase catalytic domain-containing protein n=1 Tax=Puccinia coronata f. sp. avenae TaxID=200324 RepID=A0A2N5T2K5_9BASI|nr:hypothetical protein PCASD_13171 [Puccinia coronata f. sp. avenae]
MSGPKRNQSKGKSTERVHTPEIRSSSPLIAEPPSSVHSRDDLATQLHRLETRYKATLRSSDEARTVAEATNKRMLDVEKQIGHMVDAINGITDSVNALRNASQPIPTSSRIHTTSKPPVKLEDTDTPKYSFHMKNFLKDPMALHRSIHSDIEYLKFNGENFTAWERQLNTTLKFVFHKVDFLNKDGWPLLNPDQRPSVTILLRSSIDKVLSTAVTGGKTPSEIYKLICDRCKRCDRQHKLSIVHQLADLTTSERTTSNSHFLQQFQEFYVEIKQKNINIDELMGLILQKIVKPPSNVDKHTFRNNLNHRLNTLTETPTFDRVCQELTQIEGELMSGSSSKNPIMINHTQPNPYQKGKTQNQPAPSPTTGKGSTCNYCNRNGHWVSNCRTLIRDVNAGNIKMKTSTPNNPTPTNVRVRAIDATANPSDTVLIDSGASACVSGDSPYFHLESRLTKPIPVLLASRKSNMTLTGVGSLKIPTPNGTIRIKNVYHHPSIPYVILSLGILTSHGLQLVFDQHCGLTLIHFHRKFQTTFSNNCWTLVTLPKTPSIPSTTKPNPSDIVISSMTNKVSMDCVKWHERLGHANDKIVQQFIKRFVPEKLRPEWKPFFCKKCVLAKATGHRFLPPSIVPKDSPLDLFVSDIMGPYDPNVNGFKFTVTLRDHASMFTFVSPIHAKADVPERLRVWFEVIHNHHGRYPKYLRCNNGGEFVSKRFETMLAERGILLVTSAPYHPEENGKAERVNRTINDMARVMLNNSGLPFEFWSYAQQTAAYLHNRIPHSRISPKTPIEILFNQKPTPDFIFPFGARALVFRPSEKRNNKFSDHADEAYLIGYPPSGKGWLFYHKQLRTIIQSADAVFPEFQQLPVSGFDTVAQNISLELHNLTLGQEPTDEIAAAQDLAVQSLPVRPDVAIPSNIHQALSGHDSNRWRQAAEAELDQLEKLGVWTVVKPKKGVKVIDCGDTYAPTASLATLRLLLSISVQRGYTTQSFDVSSAYLYSPIDEEVYVKPPTELRPDLKGKVLRLKKALYGTKQAGRCWWLHFKSILESLHFSASEVKSSLYVYKRDNVSIYIWMHVNDGLVVSNSPSAIDDLRSKLTDHLEVKWCPSVDQIVGLNVCHDNTGIYLEQHLLATQVTSTYTRCTVHLNTPLPDISLVTSTSPPIDTSTFRSVLGSLMYLACGTRPNISYAVNLLARFSQNPSDTHWTALDHLIGYIWKNPRKGLTFTPGDASVKLYVDAGWGGEHERSTTGFLLQHYGNPITWGSKRQDVVAMSTCAAEYVALSIATQHLANLKIVLDDIDPVTTYEILCDNQAAVLVATDNASRKKTQYLQQAFYFVNDFVRRNKVNLYWISNSEQLANVFTKRLAANKHREATSAINQVEIPSKFFPVP